jgi:3-hydroxyisobutyrate dehydrogenase-like beta-hydroxyacid dehydrogenase
MRRAIMHVGIVGTGKMGSATARNLLDRGYRVSIWNIERAPMEPLVAAGATAFEDLRSLVETVDVAIATLWDDDVARAVSLGQVIPAARKGLLFMEVSTLSPQMYETLAEAAARRGVDFLACPVLGSVDNARNGTLTLFPGGGDEAFERGKGLLSAMGSTIKFTGSPAASGHLKLASNSVLGAVACTIGELLRITGEAGVDRALAIETLANALERAGSKRRQLVERDAKPRFSADALLKDLRLAHGVRQRLQVGAPVMDSVLAEFESVVGRGVGGDDYIAVALSLERD